MHRHSNLNKAGNHEMHDHITCGVNFGDATGVALEVPSLAMRTRMTATCAYRACGLVPPSATMRKLKVMKGYGVKCSRWMLNGTPVRRVAQSLRKGPEPEAKGQKATSLARPHIDSERSIQR